VIAACSASGRRKRSRAADAVIVRPHTRMRLPEALKLRA
jgi:hypothetical protein